MTKLDEVDILGGANYHQDGPYEALSPRRNKNRNRANSDAPVAAFNPNGPNSNPGITNSHEQREFKMEPHLQVDFELTDDQPVNGPTSAGLGSTTYMENAPASEAAIREQARNARVKEIPFGHQQGEEGLLERVRSIGRGHGHSGEAEGEGLLSRVRSLSNRSRSGSMRKPVEIEPNYEEETVPSTGKSTAHDQTHLQALHRNK